ncbi:MAG: hypothetical protein ACM3S0_01765 [Acidobacteriota bacterium]
MSNDLWRYVIAGFLIMHGIGHSGGYWMFVRSWLSPELVSGPMKWVSVVVWLVVMVVFITAGIAILQQQGWWRTAALAAALVSLAISALYIQGTPFNAAAADLLILLALVFLRWPTPDLVGS